MQNVGMRLVLVFSIALIFALTGCKSIPSAQVPSGGSSSQNGSGGNGSSGSGGSGGSSTVAYTYTPAPTWCWGDAYAMNSWQSTSTNTMSGSVDFRWISQDSVGSMMSTFVCRYTIENLNNNTDYVVYCANSAITNQSNTNLIPGWTITTHLIHPDAGSFACWYDIVSN